jgi:hypothetical protein
MRSAVELSLLSNPALDFVAENKYCLSIAAMLLNCMVDLIGTRKMYVRGTYQLWDRLLQKVGGQAAAAPPGSVIIQHASVVIQPGGAVVQPLPTIPPPPNP